MITCQICAYFVFCFFCTRFLYSHCNMYTKYKCVYIFLVMLLILKTSQNYLENSLKHILRWYLLKRQGNGSAGPLTCVNPSS